MTVDRRRVFVTGAVLAVVCVGLAIARTFAIVQIERPDLGLIAISNIGFDIQLGALVIGVMLVHLVPRPLARWVLVGEGLLCVLAWGAAGAAYVLALLAWWGIIEARVLGRWRFAIAALALAAMDACAWASAWVSAVALVFSMLFTLRLIVYAYDRWQRDDEPTPLREYLVFVLCAPLVVVPPFMSIIPLFGEFLSRFDPVLTRSRLVAVVRHFVLAIVFGGARVALSHYGLAGDHLELSTMYGRFLANVLGLATIAHLALALLLLHGIEERLPLWRPLLATRMLELWQRLSVHLKDAQVFLFYTPALLRLRRKNRYAAIAVATTWTLVVGNTLVHVVARYVFLHDGVAKTACGLAANAVMATVLAIELCRDDWWVRRGGRPPRTWWSRALGWAYTMTVAAFVAVL
jgi:hypothetical protein